MDSINLSHFKQAYFLGLGGIGMSAIARYLNSQNIQVFGYDKTPSPLTEALEAEGMHITFTDEIGALPNQIVNQPNDTLFVITPAIPKDHKQYNYIQEKGWPIYKRSEVLGLISKEAFCIAVAGTHGKTTTSTMIAHILHEANINFSAFLGGISSNYQSNYISKTDGTDLIPGKQTVVLEADEFDRSFHRLQPNIAVITAADPDHLDIYGTEKAFFEAFEGFAQRIVPEGSLILQNAVNIDTPSNIHTYRYCINGQEDTPFRSNFSGIRDGYFYFSYHSSMTSPDGAIIDRDVTDVCAGLPGFHNIENATAAMAICLDLLNLDRFDVKTGIKTFKGVKRRFEFIIRTAAHVVIDDYAHHPQEITAIITSVKELFPNKKLTVAFQPHLFTRTRDFAEGFAKSLSMCDTLYLMDIYPARELPIPGITSQWLLDKVTIPNKQIANELQLLESIQQHKPELLLILGAGDIDRIVPKVKIIYEGTI